MLDNAFLKAFRDLIDRPLLNKARKIVVTFEMKPDTAEGELIGVETDVNLKETIPNRECRTQMLAVSQKHQALMFHPMTPRANHPTLPFTEGEDD